MAPARIERYMYYPICVRGEEQILKIESTEHEFHQLGLPPHLRAALAMFHCMIGTCLSL